MASTSCKIREVLAACVWCRALSYASGADSASIGHEIMGRMSCGAGSNGFGGKAIDIAKRRRGNEKNKGDTLLESRFYKTHRYTWGQLALSIFVRDPLLNVCAREPIGSIGPALTCSLLGFP